MIVVTEKGSSPILIVGETFEKNPTPEGAFVSDEANVALKIGVQTNFPSKYIDPHYIDLKREDLNDRTHYEFTEEIVIQVRQYIVDNGIELVVCMGRTTMSMIFPSLVGKGKSLAKLVQSPFIEGLEIPGVKACCIYGYSQAYDNNNENALQEYWGRLKEIFVEKPTYYVPETEITSEEELIQLLDFLDTIPKDTKLGLDYETNAVQQFHVDYKTTMIGLSYLHDKNTAPSFWFPLDIKPSDKLVERISKFFDDNHKRIWAHNCVFEILSSWHEFGKHWEFQDTLVLLTVQGKRASLKDAMRTHLGATLWESSVTEFREKTEELYKWLEKCKYKDEVFELAKNKDWKALSELHDKLKNCIDWVSDNYSEEHLPRVFDAYPYPWASVPPEVLGPYCAKDAGYTLLLSEYMWKEEFRTAYEFSIVHPYLAAKFEANGAHWDDTIAKKVEKEIIDDLLDTLYDLIMSLSTISPEDKMVAKDIYFKELPYDVITYTEKTRKEKRRTVSTKLDKVNELKGILNLGSNTAESRAKFWDCYFTEELQMGTILNIALEDIEFNQKLQPLTEKLGDNFSFYGKHPSEGLQILSSLEDRLENTPENKEIIDQALRSLNHAIDSLPEFSGKYASDVIKYQYLVHTRYLGVDINDRSTWSKEFTMLFNAYYHKKLAKTLSTNINGTIGRGVVFEVVGERNGIELRGRSITEDPTIPGGVMDFSFNPLAADTWRWSSSWHTTPAGSTTRLALVPQADNYLINHSDFSQMELVCMAYSANDQNMIKAFLEGRDMHKFMASLVHHKPYDEVTSEERRNAKACLTENNYLKLLSGEFVSIKDLDKHVGDWCYGRDVLGKVVPAQIEHWELTKLVDEVIEIELDNGIIIECTPDHKILLENGVKIPAEYLNINDIVASFNTRISEKSDKLVGYEIIEDSFKGGFTHHRVACHLGFTDEIVHHRNGNKLDNSPANLESMSKSEHSKHHIADGTIPDMSKLIDYSEVSRKMAEENKKEWKETRSANGVRNLVIKAFASLISSGLEITKDNYQQKKAKQWISWDKILELLEGEFEDLVSKAEAYSGELFDLDEIQKQKELQNKASSERMKLRFKLDSKFIEEHKKRVRERLACINQDPESRFRQQQGKVLAGIIKGYLKTDKVDLNLNLNNMSFKEFADLVDEKYSCSEQRIISYFPGETVLSLIEKAKERMNG